MPTDLSTLEQSFARFACMGDSASLARVFDETAPELLRVARHVMGRRDLAEDLLQSTFLTAMERAGRFDPSRRLEPWLIGILLKHAAAMRRRERRGLAAGIASAATAAPVERADSAPGPLLEIEGRELRAALAEAVAALPPVYREVLAPRLQSDEASGRIARGVGRSAPLVRMQITRALRMLRRLLPSGLAAPVFAFFVLRPSLAAVRKNVLFEAGAAPAAAGAAGVTGVAVGGFVMLKPVAIGLAALVALAVLWTWRDHDAGDASPAGVAAARAPAPALPATPEAPAIRAPERVDVSGTPAVERTAAAFPPDYVRSLSGVRGRLLESDGAPARGLDVTLLELKPSDLLASFERAATAIDAAPRIEVASSRTDDDGRFVLSGAHGRAVHVLGIDLGGARATLRAVLDSLAPGETRDLGDFVLPKTVELTGRVVDEDGEPVAGARVRGAQFPVPVASVCGEFLVPGCQLLIGSGPQAGVYPLPAAAARLLDHMPIPTTTTDRDGRFTFTRMPAGAITFLVDHDGFVPLAGGPVPTGAAASRDAGTFVLGRGLPLTGTVRDAAGTPVAGAEVVAAPVPMIGDVLFGTPATTDAAGRFTFEHRPERRLRVAARAHPGEPWRFADADAGDDVTIDLRASMTLTVVVTDAKAAPLNDATVRVTPLHPLGAPADALVDSKPAAVRTGDAAGNYSVGPLVPARYALVVSAPGHAAVRRRITIADDSTSGRTETVSLARGVERKIRVIDAADGKPVEFALATLLVRGSAEFALDRRRTDADGRAGLGPAPNDGALVRVEHPRFAVVTLPLPADAESDEFVVRLGVPGALVGRVTAGGLALPSRYVACLVPETRALDVDEIPATARTDERGDFSFSTVAPGSYRYRLFRDDFDGDPLRASIDALTGLQAVARGGVEVRSGETTRIEVPIAFPGMPTACTLYGVVTAGGRPINAWLSLRGTRADSLTTGADGAFRFVGVAPGQCVLTARTNVPGNVTVHRSLDVELAPGETRELRFELASDSVAFRVLDSRGAEVTKDVMIHAAGINSATQGVTVSRPALRDGAPPSEGPLWFPVAGRYRASVRDPGHGNGAVEFTVPATSPVELQLVEGADLGGTFTLSDEFPVGDEPVGMTIVYSENGRGSPSLRPDSSHGNAELTVAGGAGRAGGAVEEERFVYLAVSLPASAREFLIPGLPPGRVTLTVRCGGVSSAPIEVDLPAGGRKDFRLDFVAGD